MRDGSTALSAISNSIFETGSTFKDELNLFGQQVFFTNYRAAENKFFDEAKNYPVLKLSTPYSGSTTINIPSANSASNNYFLFVINKGSFTDSLVSIVTNSDITKNISFDYTFSTSSESGLSKIINNYYYKLNSSNLGMLGHSNVFNNEPVNGDIEKGEIEYPFPQPFNYIKNDFIYLPVSQSISGEAILNVYSVSMDLVYSGLLYISTGNKIKLKWNGFDKNNEKLPTGVYIYVVKSDDTIKKGKIVIYNE